MLSHWCRTPKEVNRRNDLLTTLKSKVSHMANTLNSYSAAYRDRLLGPDIKSDDVVKRASNMDNQGMVGFQRQIMRGMKKEAYILRSNFYELFLNPVVYTTTPHFLPDVLAP